MARKQKKPTSEKQNEEGGDNTAGASSSGRSRPTRKRAALVEKNINLDEDSDFESDDEKYVFSAKQKRKAVNTATKTGASKAEAASKKPPKRVAKADKKNNAKTGKGDIEHQKENGGVGVGRSYEGRLSTIRTHFHRRPASVLAVTNNNFLRVLGGSCSGLVKRELYFQAAVRPIVDNVSKFRVSQLVTPFSRRVTALAWHPRHPHLAAAGSKGGDIILWDSSGEGRAGGQMFKSMIEGRGPGGSIQSLKFDNQNPDKVYTASIDGTVTRHDFNGQDNKIYLETNDWERWYVGMDVSFSGRMMVAGNNKGTVTLLNLDSGEKIWDLKLHKSKCNFVQFSDRQPWMMVTTSTGAGAAAVKVWDIRNIRGQDSVLAELHHDKAVNSAYFSPLAGDKLLTTDQHSQLRVYQAPHFDLLRTIPHPHRQFQHLTPIKACWHPLADIVLAGRYPDPQFPGWHEGELRTIDLFCPESGAALHQLHQPGLNHIISLSQFNAAGDRLLSGMGQTVMIWQQGRHTEAEEERADTRTVDTNIEGLTLQHWPDFTAKKKQSKKKKETKTKEN